MILGIQKHQVILLLVVILMPLLLNGIAIWQDMGTVSILEMFNGTYKPPLFLISYNPLPGIFLKLLLYVSAPGLLAWLMVFISKKTIFQKQPFVFRFCETVLMALFIATVFVVVSGSLMPLVWLPIFHDYLLGLPTSVFMEDWSRWLIFPATTIFMLSNILLSSLREGKIIVNK